MKKLFYKSGLLLISALLIIPLAITAQEVKKEFHKEFSGVSNKAFELSNKYGAVNIKSWTNDQVVIDVTVTVELPNQDKAKKLLEYITVEFSESGNLVSAKTIIDDKFSFSGWGNSSRKFTIDYEVKMPVTMTMALSNKYGNTFIDELTGQLTIDIKYGNLTAGKLTRGNEKPLNSLNLGYGKATIDEAGWMDLTIRYGGTTITKSQALLIDSRYSKLAFGETSSAVGDSKYDNIRIEKINNLDIENGYSDVNIGTLTKKLNYEGSYGSFAIDNIPAGFESLSVDTRYMGVKLGIAENASYNLYSKISYGGLKYNEENFTNQKRVIESNSSEIMGIVGKESSPSAKVTVSSSYGSVRLYQ